MWSRSMTGPPPESAFVVNQPPNPGMPVRRIHLAWAELMRPTAPLSISFFISRDSGRARLLKLNIRCFPALSRAAIMSRTSAAFIAGGFSQNTCLPASSAWIARGAWNLLGTMMETASMSLASISATSP
jgi:hypothetical protein